MRSQPCFNLRVRSPRGRQQLLQHRLPVARNCSADPAGWLKKATCRGLCCGIAAVTPRLAPCRRVFLASSIHSPVSWEVTAFKHSHGWKQDVASRSSACDAFPCVFLTNGCEPPRGNEYVSSKGRPNHAFPCTCRSIEFKCYGHAKKRKKKKKKARSGEGNPPSMHVHSLHGSCITLAANVKETINITRPRLIMTQSPRAPA